MSVKQESLNQKFNLLFKQIDGLINADQPAISSLANITAAIKSTFDKVSWVGFYLREGNFLFLGPFQGGVACTKIEIGKGVCGTAAELQKSQVVPNVHEYPGHIACDVESKSEIVVPITVNNNIIGVLDLDSKEYNQFDQADKLWLEKICKLISDRVNFEKINF
jgi:GAF domain-containing protein